MKGSDPDATGTASPGESKGRVRFKVEIDKACGHDVKPLDVKLKKKRDELGWEITNDCDYDQKVLLCVYNAETGVLVKPPPFDQYTSTPSGLEIGTTFTVESTKKATLKCTGEVAGEFTIEVLVDKDVPSGGCPPRRQKGERTHRLGVIIL